MSLDEIPPHDEEDPRERELRRRSGNPPLGIWLIVGLLMMLGFGAYVVFSLT
ncbi:MAG: hypothetical protein K2X61_02090 [Caulobacteraceae bacterium]|nr:hypothetical protein [Caulobacteraceae bacterium]